LETPRTGCLQQAKNYPHAAVAMFKDILFWLFGPEPRKETSHLWSRWIFLRALGAIFFSAFYSLAFQIEGLIGPRGILPAREYLDYLLKNANWERYWFAPTLLWLGSGSEALHALVWSGLAASLLLVFNFWPRGTIAICTVAFLSFIAAARDFADYQSDGMLLAAGFISLFFAPPGFRPGLGESNPPSRASLFLLQWEWFRIYFESGIAKLASHDPEWRHLTAMDQYYQNGPLPTWIGWYVQQWPHWFQASTTLATLIVELGLCWLFILPRRFRIAAFLILTPFQIGIILTGNYAFLNYLVLSLGFLLLDDRAFQWVGMERWRQRIGARFHRRSFGSAPKEPDADAARSTKSSWLRLVPAAFFLTWIFYADTVLLLRMVAPRLPLPAAPAAVLDPFRFANQYGLFAVMTTARYEIEFQGSVDGKTWVAYPFRYKPQDPAEPPGIYAPYQPRFEWNLWFASLSNWQSNMWVVRAEESLLGNDTSVLKLFRSNPFPQKPPLEVRALIWQYWFTDPAIKRRTGLWWRRKLIGLYAPVLERQPDGKISIVGLPPGPDGFSQEP
jgi:Lipase maturation factor